MRIFSIPRFFVSDVHYNIAITTGNEPNAGTDANVFLQLFGEGGQTKPFKLREAGDSKRFSRGRTDKFSKQDKDVGKVSISKLISVSEKIFTCCFLGSGVKNWFCLGRGTWVVSEKPAFTALSQLLTRNKVMHYFYQSYYSSCTKLKVSVILTFSLNFFIG